MSQLKKLEKKSTREYYHDSKEDGLTLCITPAGTMTFYIRKRYNGKDERFRIGKFPDITIEQARKKAQTIKGQLATGEDPIGDKRRLRIDITFGEMFDRYIEDYAQNHTKTWEQDIADINGKASHWLKRKASTITHAEIVKIHNQVGKDHGKYAANRFIERLNSIYNRSIKWEWQHPNPVTGIQKFKNAGKRTIFK